MRILFTADLHLNMSAKHPRTRRTALETFSEIVENENPSVVVVAGDIGAIGRAQKHLVAIRKAVGDRLLAITLGNHDFWMDSYGHSDFARIHQLITRFWQKPAREVDAVLLDRETADFGDFAIVGGYGHYDLGLAEPGLVIGGNLVTEDVYLSGGIGGLFWNDFRYIPNCGTLLHEESRDQANGIASRMDAAINAGKRLLLAIHTCPWRELNGHPLTGREDDILSAYSGNSLLGHEIEKRAASVDFLMCGHTHMPVSERSIHGIPCLNVGADYGIFRGVIYDTITKNIKWIGETFSQ